MRLLLFISNLLILALIGCDTQHKNVGRTNIFFEAPSTYTVSPEVAFKSDSCILRFRNKFTNDSIWISSGKLKNLIIANTRESLAFACSYTVKKLKENELHIQINETDFLVPFKKEYYFIDIYKYTRDTINIYYSNNIAVLY